MFVPLYLRCLLTANAAHRNSLMSGSGRHFTKPSGFSSAGEEVPASSTFLSFCPRIVNHSAWSRSMMAHRSCWLTFLWSTLSSNRRHTYETDRKDYCTTANSRKYSTIPFFEHLHNPAQEPTALGEVVSCFHHTSSLTQYPDDLSLC